MLSKYNEIVFFSFLWQKKKAKVRRRRRKFGLLRIEKFFNIFISETSAAQKLLEKSNSELKKLGRGWRCPKFYMNSYFESNWIARNLSLNVEIELMQKLQLMKSISVCNTHFLTHTFSASIQRNKLLPINSNWGNAFVHWSKYRTLEVEFF